MSSNHLKAYRRSLSDLTYEEKRDLHIAIRLSRLTPKVVEKRRATSRRESKAQKLNKVIQDMSAEELEQLLRNVKAKRS